MVPRGARTRMTFTGLLHPSTPVGGERDLSDRRRECLASWVNFTEGWA